MEEIRTINISKTPKSSIVFLVLSIVAFSLFTIASCAFIVDLIASQKATEEGSQNANIGIGKLFFYIFVLVYGSITNLISIILDIISMIIFKKKKGVSKPFSILQIIMLIAPIVTEGIVLLVVLRL